MRMTVNMNVREFVTLLSLAAMSDGHSEVGPIKK